MSGLAMAVGGPPPSAAAAASIEPAWGAAEQAALRDAAASRLGFALALAPSRLPGAGTGLFLRGRAPVGTVVAFYPGLSYPPSHWHFIPGVKVRHLFLCVTFPLCVTCPCSFMRGVFFKVLDVLLRLKICIEMRAEGGLPLVPVPSLLLRC